MNKNKYPVFIIFISIFAFSSCSYFQGHSQVETQVGAKKMTAREFAQAKTAKLKYHGKNQHALTEKEKISAREFGRAKNLSVQPSIHQSNQ